MQFPDILRAPARNLKYALWLPLYLLCFLLLEHLVTSGYWPTQLPIDGLIPFWEGFVVFYSLWYPMLLAVGLYLLFRDLPGFQRYMAFLGITFFLSVLIWFLLPNGQDLRPAVMPRDNLFTHWIAALYTVDTNTNVFPSVHVLGAVGAAWAVRRSPALKERRLLCRGTVLLAALICASTLFIKQHTVLDVIGGLVLSLAVGVPIYFHSGAYANTRRRVPAGRKESL